MGKSVGMITMYRQNYGAFLQAYALQQALIRCGYRPELIRYDYYNDKSICEIPICRIKQPVWFFHTLLVSLLKHRQHSKRKAVFAQSISKHLRESGQYYKTYKALEKDPPAYDLYLTGSDQVFNTKLSPQATRSRFLCFTSGRKASYAASAGTAGMPKQNRELMQKALRGFENISVREDHLKDELGELLQRPIYKHMDPSLLLTRCEWKEFEEVYAEGKYIFFYRVLAQPELNRVAEKLSEELDLPILAADGNDQFTRQIPRKDYLSPEQWVSALNHASYVVTNSFHGTAFSINLHKRAFVMIPPSAGVRVGDLIKNCKLERLLDINIIAEHETEALYARADQYLDEQRKRAYEYIQIIGGDGLPPDSILHLNDIQLPDAAKSI